MPVQSFDMAEKILHLFCFQAIYNANNKIELVKV